MQLARPGTLDLVAAFPRMHDGEDAYYVTDSSLGELADALSGSSPPLLMRTPMPMADGDVLGGSVTLTDAGEAVLAGRMDRVAACGISRWLGGVHLNGDANLWRWDDMRQRIRNRRRAQSRAGITIGGCALDSAASCRSTDGTTKRRGSRNHGVSAAPIGVGSTGAIPEALPRGTGTSVRGAEHRLQPHRSQR